MRAGTFLAMHERIALVMAGGGGTRLWPVSTPDRPKQLVNLRPGTFESLLSTSIDRMATVVDATDIWVVTSTSQVEGVRNAVPSLSNERIIAEPYGRNTAPCIALSLMHMRARLGATVDQAVVLALPADHHVADTDGFRRHVRVACAYASTHDVVVALGITPRWPEPGYGYIERGAEPIAPTSETEQVSMFPAVRFVEKPPLDRILEFLGSGRYLWNSGIFAMPFRRIEYELQRLCPDMWQALVPVAERLRSGSGEHTMEATLQAYRAIPPVSIDIAVMEKLDDLVVVPTEIGWTDLGSWKALYGVLDKDEHGTSIRSGSEAVTVVEDCSDTLVWNDDARVGVLGVHGVAVVVSRDGVLVCPLERAHEIRELVEQLTRK